MKLKKPLPPNRNFEQILNHYLVEKSIANRLKKSNREERKLILATMYDELFKKVPDHPRLTRRDSVSLTVKSNREKFSLVYKFLNTNSVFLEFAPGDCKFTYEIARHVKLAYGVDISDQRNPKDEVPDNFQLIIYDGFGLDDLEKNSIDIIFSDQLIEHFHPDDTKLHFEITNRLLKPGGKYIFRTPHPFTGPHDVSAYFCDEAEGFHLKEWTYREIKKILLETKYSDFHTRWRKKSLELNLPYYYFYLGERILGALPKGFRKRISKYLIPSLYGIAVK